MRYAIALALIPMAASAGWKDLPYAAPGQVEDRRGTVQKYPHPAPVDRGSGAATVSEPGAPIVPVRVRTIRVIPIGKETSR